MKFQSKTSCIKAAQAYYKAYYKRTSKLFNEDAETALNAFKLKPLSEMRETLMSLEVMTSEEFEATPTTPQTVGLKSAFKLS